MRWVFIILALANVALAVWFNSEREPMLPLDTSPVALDSGERRLRLLRELPTGELVSLVPTNAELPPLPEETLPQLPALVAGEAGSIVEATVEEAVSPDSPLIAKSASCFRISNIGTKVARDTLATKLLAQNLTVLERGEAFEERETYWVYIPPLKSPAAAREVMATLTKLKQSDFMLVRVGEFENGISLGLFSQREGAEKRLKEISALGLKTRSPEMRARTSSVRSYWLLIKSQGDEAHSRLQGLIRTGSGSPLPIDCPP